MTVQECSICNPFLPVWGLSLSVLKPPQLRASSLQFSLAKQQDCASGSWLTAELWERLRDAQTLSHGWRSPSLTATAMTVMVGSNATLHANQLLTAR